MKLWNSDGTPRAVLDGHQSAVTDLDWHPTGDSLVSVDALEVICRWSKTGELLERRQSSAGKVPQAIVWAPDGDSYSVAGNGRRIVHLPEANTTPEPIEGHNLRLTDVEWDSAGTRFATTGVDRVVRVFDRDAKPSLFIKTPSEVYGLAWSPDDKQLATSQGEHIVQIWNLTTRRETNSLKPPGDASTLYSVAWNSITGELAVTSANQSATVWRLPNTSSPLQRIHNGPVYCAEWIPDSRLLVTAGRGADVQIGEPGKGVLALRAGANVVTALGCSSDGKLIAAISDHLTLDVWKTDGTRITSRAVDTGALADAIDWSRDSKTLFALRGDGHLVQLGVDAEVRRDVPLHHSLPTAIAVHRDGHNALSADNGGTIIKWSTKTLEPEWVLVTMPEGESLQFSASGELLRGNHELFEREMVYVVEDETGRRHLLTPSEFEHRRSLPGDFSISDEHADRRFAQWVLDRGGVINGKSSIEDSAGRADVLSTPGDFRVDFSSVPDFNDADLMMLSRLRPARRLGDLILTGTKVSATGVQHLLGLDLVYLNLRQTNVTDEISETLSSFENLFHLDLSQSQVTAACLAKLSANSIRKLNLVDIPLSVEDLGRLVDRFPALTTLEFGGYELPDDKVPGDAWLKHLSRLRDLQVLVLHHTNITNSGIAHLSSGDALIGLITVGSQIDDSGLLQIVTDHPNLQTLELAACQITDHGIAHFSNLTHLRRLVLTSCKHLTSTGFAHLVQVKDVEHLILKYTAVSDADLMEFAKLPSLKTLELTRTSITDAGLAHLHSLHSLEVLNVQGTEVTPDGVAQLQAKLPDCSIVAD